MRFTHRDTKAPDEALLAIFLHVLSRVSRRSVVVATMAFSLCQWLYVFVPGLLFLRVAPSGQCLDSITLAGVMGRAAVPGTKLTLLSCPFLFQAAGTSRVSE